jgi:FkbM family methyltransferase
MMIDFDYIFNKYNIQSKGVLHCGASTGQEASDYDRLGLKRMVFIEAIPDVYEELKKHIIVYPLALAINECVSDKDGEEVTFNISNNESQSSSFLELGHHKQIHPTVHYVGQFHAITKTVDTIVREYDIDLSEINFCNCDLQGAELMALKGMKETINYFKYLYLEVNKKNTYIGCPMIEEIDEYVHQFGFERVETGVWVADTWTDALYIKK